MEDLASTRVPILLMSPLCPRSCWCVLESTCPRGWHRATDSPESVASLKQIVSVTVCWVNHLRLQSRRFLLVPFRRNGIETFWPKGPPGTHRPALARQPGALHFLSHEMGVRCSSWLRRESGGSHSCGNPMLIWTQQTLCKTLDIIVQLYVLCLYNAEPFLFSTGPAPSYDSVYLGCHSLRTYCVLVILESSFFVVILFFLSSQQTVCECVRVCICVCECV